MIIILVIYIFTTCYSSHQCFNTSLLYSDLVNCTYNSGIDTYDCPNEADYVNFPLNLTTATGIAIESDSLGNYITKGSIIDPDKLIYNSGTDNLTCVAWFLPQNNLELFIYNIEFKYRVLGPNKRIDIDDHVDRTAVCNNCFETGVLHNFIITMNINSMAGIDIFINGIKVFFHHHFNFLWDTETTIFRLNQVGANGNFYHFSCYLDHLPDEIIVGLYENGHNYTETQICENCTAHDDEIVLHCFGIEHYDPLVCSSNGICVSHDTCSCGECYYGDYCQNANSSCSICNMTCFDISSKFISVCSGNGVCISSDNCSCIRCYSGNECQFYNQTCACETVEWCPNLIQCFDVNSTDLLVCSGHGICTSQDVCDCVMYVILEINVNFIIKHAHVKQLNGAKI
jgi:hypothetical protein